MNEYAGVNVRLSMESHRQASDSLSVAVTSEAESLALARVYRLLREAGRKRLARLVSENAHTTEPQGSAAEPAAGDYALAKTGDGSAADSGT